MLTEPVSAQATVFLLTVAIGLLLGFLFDAYRVVRGRLRPGPAGTAAGDLLFWLAATGVVFALLILSNWGELRLYVWVGFVLGALSYHFLLSRTVIGLLVGLATALEQTFGALSGRIVRLANLPGQWARRFWRRTRAGHALQRFWRWVRGDSGRSAPPPAG